MPSDPFVTRDYSAAGFAVAWKRYVELLGEPPHGTEKQMAGLLELLPLRADFATRERENERLRVMLFDSHGCDGKYGDDGEMQCNRAPFIDFKRDPVEELEQKTVAHGMQQLSARDRENAELRSASEHIQFNRDELDAANERVEELERAHEALRAENAELRAQVEGLRGTLEKIRHEARDHSPWWSYDMARLALSRTPAEHASQLEARIRNEERRALLEKAGIATGVGLPIEIGLEDAEAWLEAQRAQAFREGMERAAIICDVCPECQAAIRAEAARSGKETTNQPQSADDQLRAAARAIYAKYGPDLGAFFRDIGCPIEGKEPRS